MTPSELIKKSFTLKMRGVLKSIRTKYKYVKSYTHEGATVYYAQLSRYGWSKMFENLHEAAKAVDLKLISKGKKPVNVLKPKL